MDAQARIDGATLAAVIAGDPDLRAASPGLCEELSVPLRERLVELSARDRKEKERSLRTIARGLRPIGSPKKDPPARIARLLAAAYGRHLSPEALERWRAAALAPARVGYRPPPSLLKLLSRQHLYASTDGGGDEER